MSAERPETPVLPVATPKTLAWVLAGALVLRLLILIGTAGLGPRVSDERDYLQLAARLTQGQGYSYTTGPTSLRPPLYPAFVASVWMATRTNSLQLVRLAQGGLAIVTAWLAYRLGTRVYDARAGVAAAAVTALYPALIFENFLALSESLFTALLIAAALALVRLLQQPSASGSLVAGVLLGLAALTRSVVWPFPFVVSPLIAWWVPGSQYRRLVVGGLVLTGSLLVIAPWAIRNTRLQGVPVVIDTMGGLNLRMGNYEYTPDDRIWDAVSMSGAKSWIVGIPDAPPDGGVWTEGKKERWARAEAVRYMVAHPGVTLWRTCIKFGDFWGLDRDFLAGVEQGLFHPPAWFTAIAGAALLTGYPAVLALAVAAIVLAPPTDRRTHVVLILIVGFVCTLHSIVFGHPRYRLPLMPVLAVYAGAAATRLDRAAIVNVRRAWPVFATLGLFLAIWVVQFAWRDAAFVSRLVGRS